MSFVAISKVTFPAELKAEIQAVGLAMLPIAKRQPGHVSIAFHEANEESATMMYWEWESQADHENCMKTDDWSELMSNNMAVFEKDGVEFSITTFNRLA